MRLPIITFISGLFLTAPVRAVYPPFTSTEKPPVSTDKESEKVDSASKRLEDVVTKLEADEQRLRNLIEQKEHKEKKEAPHGPCVR